MGIVFRQSIKTSIVIAAGAVLGFLINYASSHILTQQQFGYTKNLPIQACIFHIFVMLGLGSTLLNFSARYGARDEKRKILITLSTFAPFVSTTLLSIPYFIFKQDILELFSEKDRIMAGRYYPMVPLFIFLWSYMVSLECYLVTQSKVAVQSFIREIVIRLLNLLLLVLFYFSLISFSQMVYGIVGSYMTAVILLLRASRKTEDFGFSLNWNVFTRADYKEIFQYSWYHMLVNATVYMLGFVDSLLLGSRLSGEGLSSLAVYTNAVFIAAIMVIPYRAMSPASIPTLNNAYLSGDFRVLKNIFHRSGINILIAGMAMFVLIACNLDNLVAFFPPEYAAIKPVALILMIGRMIDMATGLNTELTSISKHYKFNFRVSILLLVILVGCGVALIPQYGIYGAAWSATIALAAFNILKMFFVWWKMRIQPFTKKSFLVLLAGAIALAVGYFFPALFSGMESKLAAAILDAGVRSLLIVICYAGILIWLKPSDDLNEYLISIKTNKRLF